MKPAPRVVHVWGEYTPSLFDQVHPYLLRSGAMESTLVAQCLLSNGASLPDNVHSFSTARVDSNYPDSFVSRAARRIRERASWLAFNPYLLSKVHSLGGSILHAHFGTTAGRILPALWSTKLPALVSFYGYDASACLRQWSWRRRYGWVFQRVGGVIVLCEEVRRRLVEVGCPAEKIHVWNLPANVESYPYAPRRDTGVTRFLIAARFVEKKGYRVLLQAFSKLVAAGEPVRLTLIGYGVMQRELMTTIAALPAGSVTLIDTELRADFAELYRKALAEHDVFVLPSTTAATGDDEGGPALTMIAAQAAGLPVICTPFAGAERSLIPGTTGLLCDTDDASSLADRMRELIGQEARWNELGRAGSQHVARHFSLEGQMTRLLDLYRALLPA